MSDQSLMVEKIKKARAIFMDNDEKLIRHKQTRRYLVGGREVFLNKSKGPSMFYWTPLGLIFPDCLKRARIR